jgi:hypothetical protein
VDLAKAVLSVHVVESRAQHGDVSSVELRLFILLLEVMRTTASTQIHRYRENCWVLDRCSNDVSQGELVIMLPPSHEHFISRDGYLLTPTRMAAGAPALSVFLGSRSFQIVYLSRYSLLSHSSRVLGVKSPVKSSLSLTQVLPKVHGNVIQ